MVRRAATRPRTLTRKHGIATWRVVIGTAGLDVAEIQTEASTVLASESNRGVDLIGYALVVGADHQQFELDETTGGLTFQEVPNFERPKSAHLSGGGGDQLAGGRGKTAEQMIAVAVTDMQARRQVRDRCLPCP